MAPRWSLLMTLALAAAPVAADAQPAAAPADPATAAATAAPAPAPAPAADPAALPEGALKGVAGCARCHRRIAAEWATAGHAKATLEANPLYAVLVGKAEAALGPEAAARCRNCHYPTWTAAARSAGAPVEGVACLSCHRIPAGHPTGRLPGGERALLAAGTGTAGGTDGAGGLCLSCHAELKNPQGHPVCTTAAESAGAGETCVGCHMPRRDPPPKDARDGRRSHAFPGAYDDAFLRTAARLEAALDGPADARAVRVTVTADGTGHHLPTGNPMRAVVLRVQAESADGAVLWRNAGDNPLAEAPEAVFQKVFRDAAGKGPVPPFVAKGPATENRPAADTPREGRYPLPAGTRRVRVRLDFHRGPAPLLQSAGLPAAAVAPTVLAERVLDVP